jgi:hypothetical protein
MVDMRPNFIDSKAPNGEVKLFNLLRDAKGADNWIAMHSLDIFGDIPTGQGESDMVVLIPGKGVLFIEVKSHDSVTYRKGTWRYNGEISTKGPVKQASNAMYGVINYLKSQKVDTREVPFGFIVWLTGGKKQDVDPSPEWKPWMILDSSDLKADIKGTLIESLEQTIELKGLWKHIPRERLAPVPRINEIAKFLRPDVQFEKSSEMRIADLRASLTLAIDQQQVIMEVFKGKKTPVIVPGAAGTGKTHLAIAEAKRAHQRGDRTLFICFNKVLAQHLKSELAGFSFVEVHNIHSYMTQVSDQTAPDLHDESWWRTVLPHLAQEAILEKGPLDRFDCLIVDEAQDICIESYLDVLDLSLEKGIANSPSFFFGDFEHQAIYMNGPVALEKLREKARGAFESTALDVNCRNTKEIGDTVMQILGLPNMYSGYRRKDSGVKPTLIRVEDGVVPDNYVKSELARLAKTFPLEDIVLLSSNRKLLQDLVATLKFETVSIDNPKKGRLRWGTAQAFKGMEAAAVILVEFEDGASSRDTFYIGSTRSLAELACIMPAKTIDKLVRGN